MDKETNMLLTEILNKPIPNLKVSGKTPVNDLLRNKQHKVLGTGSQVIAYLHSKFPGKVIKTIQISGTSDPQYQFLRVCLKHQNNPYFPKIYGVKMYKSGYNPTTDKDIPIVDVFNVPYDDILPDRQNNILYVITERLHSLPAEQFIDILAKLNITPTIEDLTKEERKLISIIKGNKIEYFFRCAFDRSEFRRKIYNQTNDPNLKQALRILEPLFKNFYPDMHSDNILARTPSQLVFIDPISENWTGDD